MLAVLTLVGLSVLGIAWTEFKAYPVFTYDAECENGVCRHPENLFVVNRKIDDATWDLFSPKFGHVMGIFCSTYRPKFDANGAPIPGIQLSWFKYEDRGFCWNIAPKDLGYKINRYANGDLVTQLPPVSENTNGIPITRAAR